MRKKVEQFGKGDLSYMEMTKSYQGWQAYAKWANTLKLRKQIAGIIAKVKHEKAEKVKKEGRRISLEMQMSI